MASNNNRLTPRQKMINLMYIVLTAMLALNVSSDVLNGFKQVEDGLERSTSNASLQNDALYQKLADFNSQNPEKGGPWYKKSLEVKKQTALLYDYIDSLKNVIVKKADGKDGDVNNIEHQDDLEAASYIMLSPAQKQGMKGNRRLPQSHRQSHDRLHQKSSDRKLPFDHHSLGQQNPSPLHVGNDAVRKYAGNRRRNHSDENTERRAVCRKRSAAHPHQ